MAYKMNVILSSVVLTLCVLLSHCLGAYNTQEEWKIINFRAVTSSDELMTLYYKVRRSITDHTARPQEATDPQKRKNVKKSICKNIFSSPHFEKRSERWVNTDLDTVRKRLKDYYVTVYNTIFRTSLSSSSSSIREYTNPYELKATVYMDVNGLAANENVFLCIVAEDTTGAQSEQFWYKEYYISREYNVNLVENAFPIVGRFIFSMNALQELQLEALAEESATSWDFVRRFKLNESFYLWQRNDTRAVTDPQLDPVCSLSDDDKVRLCAVLLGTPMFEKKGLKFIPEIVNVQKQCEKRRVKIRTPVFARGIRIVTRAIMNPHRSNDEWVIGCRASGERSKTFYVARGAHYNTIFAFKESRRNQDLSTTHLSLFGYFDNVSVVGDLETVTRINEPIRTQTTPNTGRWSSTFLHRTEIPSAQPRTRQHME